MMNRLWNMRGQRRNQYLPSLILGTFVPLNLALLITFACLKENLLLNVENMRKVFMTCHTTIMAIPRSIIVFIPSLGR